MQIVSEAELNAALIEIDAKLRRENINIPARPMCALSELSSRLHIRIEIPGELSNRIFTWFDRLYGVRLQMGLSLGVTATVIGGDPYKVRLPLMFGTSAYVLDTGPPTRPTTLEGRQTILTNIAQYVDGLTAARIETTTTEERNEVVTLFSNAMVAGSDIDAISYPEFVPEGKADLATSVDHLLSRPPQYGLSRWASLQAVEKFLKGFIQERGGQPKRIHVLNDLASAAEVLNLAQIDRTALAAVQCSAGVRYGSESSTLSQAVGAHRAATGLCGAIAIQFRARNDWKIARFDGTSRDGSRRMVLLMRGTQADFDRAQSALK